MGFSSNLGEFGEKFNIDNVLGTLYQNEPRYFWKKRVKHSKAKTRTISDEEEIKNGCNCEECGKRIKEGLHCKTCIELL